MKINFWSHDFDDFIKTGRCKLECKENIPNILVVLFNTIVFNFDITYIRRVCEKSSQEIWPNEPGEWGL